MPAKTAAKKAKTKPPPPAVRKVEEFTHQPVRRWLKILGLKAWDELFDGNIWEIELPNVDDDDEGEEMELFYNALLAAHARWRVHHPGFRLQARRHPDHPTRQIQVQMVEE